MHLEDNDNYQYITGAYISHHVNLELTTNKTGYEGYYLIADIDLLSPTDDVWPEDEVLGLTPTAFFADGDYYEFDKYPTLFDRCRSHNIILAPGKWQVDLVGYLYTTGDAETEDGCHISSEIIMQLDANGKLIVNEPENNRDEFELSWYTVTEYSKPAAGSGAIDSEAVNALIDARFNNNNGTLTPNDDHLKFDDKVTSPVTSATLDDNGYYNVTYAPGTGVGSTS